MNRNAGEICFIAKEEEGEKLSRALFNKEVHCNALCLVLFIFSYFEADNKYCCHETRDRMMDHWPRY